MTPEIGFWFDFGSNYSYLSVNRIGALAEAAGVRIHWRPFMLSSIFDEIGWSGALTQQNPRKAAYIWRDMERLCERFGLPWGPPTEFPRLGALATRVAMAADNAPWLPAFCRNVMVANFGCDLDVDSEKFVREQLQHMGVDAAQLLHRAQMPSTQHDLESRAQDALSRGVFGTPSFTVGHELFWGNDRLEDALEWALRLGRSAD